LTGGTEPRHFTASQRDALGTRGVDQDRTLDAIHELESALGAAAPGREPAWRRDVLAALVVLDESTTQEQRNAEEPDSLLSDIARTQSRLRSRVRGVRAQYKQLRETITSLRRELAAEERNIDFADLRQRLAWLLTALRHQRARESDLLYEAYYDAFNTDVESDTAD
jgi:septal ring factor EnvC (AmiA/AmiB activator)